MKSKPYVWVSEKQRQDRKRNAFILAMVMLGSLIFVPLSLYGRNCLMADGSVRRYNVFNRVVDEHASGQIDHVTFSAETFSSGKYSSYHWGVAMRLTTKNGKNYYFDYSSFRDSSKAEEKNWLLEMVKLKDRYDKNAVSCDGDEQIEKVIDDRHLTTQEIQLLYVLFGVSK